MQKYCLVLFGTLNTEWKWKWIMNVYRQDCSKFEKFEKVACCCCCWISISPWWTLELLTELITKEIFLNMFLVPFLNFWFKVCFIFVESCSQVVKLRLIGGLIKFYFHSGSVHDQSSFLIWDDKICWDINGFPQISHFYPARCCLSPPLNCEWDTIEFDCFTFLDIGANQPMVCPPRQVLTTFPLLIRWKAWLLTFSID